MLRSFGEEVDGEVEEVEVEVEEVEVEEVEVEVEEDGVEDGVEDEEEEEESWRSRRAEREVAEERKASQRGAREGWRGGGGWVSKGGGVGAEREARRGREWGSVEGAGVSFFPERRLRAARKNEAIVRQQECGGES